MWRWRRLVRRHDEDETGRLLIYRYMTAPSLGASQKDLGPGRIHVPEENDINNDKLYYEYVRPQNFLGMADPLKLITEMLFVLGVIHSAILTSNY